MRLDNRIVRLRSQGLKDDIVLSILATEMTFRPQWFRFLEYLSVGLFNHGRTIGIGQIHVKHWNRQGYYGFQVVIAALNAENNYNICKEIIDRVDHNASTVDKLNYYTGALTHAYHSKFREFQKLIREWERNFPKRL